MTGTPQQVADNYRAAFRAENGYDVECLYERGWFRIRHLNSAFGTRHRRKEILDFTERLRERTQQKAS